MSKFHCRQIGEFWPKNTKKQPKIRKIAKSDTFLVPVFKNHVKKYVKFSSHFLSLFESANNTDEILARFWRFSRKTQKSHIFSSNFDKFLNFEKSRMRIFRFLRFLTLKNVKKLNFFTKKHKKWHFSCFWRLTVVWEG